MHSYKVGQLVPYRIRTAIGKLYRHTAFKRAMTRFLNALERNATIDDEILKELIYGWGNENWSALDEFLSSCIVQALQVQGPILECGSGLSTILVGMAAQIHDKTICTLEHNSVWAARVRRILNRYDITSVSLITTPLKDYGSFCWYEPPVPATAEKFSFVICDGPPGTTKGGRYGLVAVMKDRLAPGCVIYLDDAGRTDEQSTAQRWETELGATLRVLGTKKPFAELVLPHDETPQ